MGTRIEANGGLQFEPFREDQKPVWKEESRILCANPTGEYTSGEALSEMRAARFLLRELGTYTELL